MMWHALVWALIALLALFWTGGTLALHWLLTGPDWSMGAVQDWMGWLERWQIPVWLAAWLPMEAITALKAWLTAIGPLSFSLSRPINKQDRDDTQNFQFTIGQGF